MPANDYFDWASGSRFIRFDTVRSLDANAALDLVTAGFTKLPSLLQMWGGSANYAVDTGVADAYVATVNATVAAYYDGLSVRLKAGNANSGAGATLNLNAIGAKPLAAADGSLLAAGSILPGQIIMATFSTTSTPGGQFHLQAAGPRGALGLPGTNSPIVRSARVANVMLAHADANTFIDITGGTFAQTFDTPANLVSGWSIFWRNSGTGDVTLTANGCTIDGLASFISYPGEIRLIQCDGANLRSLLLAGGTKVFTTSGNYTVPPGGEFTDTDVIGAGGGGGGGYSGVSYAGGFANGGAGGGAGARVTRRVLGLAGGTVVAVTIGAAGTAGAGAINTAGGSDGGNGGTSSFGNYVQAFGGGGGKIGVGGSTTNTGGGGGGSATAGSSTGTGGAPTPSGTSVGIGTGGSSGGTAGGQSSEWGGSGGGGNNGSTGSSAGGSSIAGPTGGGSGGSCNNAATAYLGSPGGLSGGAWAQGATTSTATGLGGAGAAGTVSAITGMGQGGAGGDALRTAGTGGAGGTGAAPGGGGGGGGAATGPVTAIGGAGGLGARGEVRVTTY